MFNNKEKNGNGADRQSGATLIAAGTKLTGNVSGENDMRIDGTILGNVTSTAKIIVGPTGYVEGNIEGAQADINGKVLGNIVTTELLQMRGECHIQGDITVGKLQVDPTATFNGNCRTGVGANIVQMSNDVQAEAK